MGDKMPPMAQPAAKRNLTPEQYLAFERSSEERHEYAGGEVLAMTGGSLAHNLIVGNLVAELRSALRSRGCFVCPSDMRVKITASERYTYPDVTVVCGEPELEDEQRDTLLNPTPLVEVLSDSTESYDRGETFAHYRRLPSLTDYLLVAQTEILVEHFARQPDGSWLLRTYGPGETLALPSLGCELLLSEIYLNVLQ